ncbi:hypothetical protein SAMN02745248_01363 [Hathewaya proteolytica DSM 3090]|uniref:Uncharacterized protein n=1 Tax=Hathewaya proteolytica DSM 3090 TaxID=1121331 RepID=A0A1M6NE84_9CLOT|nr:DUF6514 family protein [Hathewaya proteolytica]SHJ94041.1 hypothetical protein SAMN02745248_01363 [Hathewaya proteolytica DSM 3090]
MEIIETILKQVIDNEVKYNYIYRLIKSETSLYIKDQLTVVDTYGIEVERQDVVNGTIVNIERDCVKTISPKMEKVANLMELISENNTSPIHLVYVLGEYIDSYVEDFTRDIEIA